MVGDGEIDNITAIAIRYNGVERVINADGNYDVGGRRFTVDFDPAAGNPFGPNGNNTVNVTGLLDGVQIATYTGDGYTTLEYSYVSGSAFPIGGFGASVINAGVPVNFAVPVQLVDADGDTADSSIVVTLEPEAQPLASVNIAANLLTQTNPSSVVTIQFSEAPVNFTDADISAVGGTVTGLAVTADPLVYTATFTATAGFSGIGSVTVGTAWQDADGNPGVGNDDVVAIDRSSPTVVDVVANDLVITDSDAVADTFSIAVTFSEAMNTSATPTLIFAPSVASTLTLTGGAWSAANTVYTASYTVADANVVVNGVTVDVTGAQDLAGNAQEDYSAVAEFSIDTENPTVTVNIVDGVAERRRHQLGGDLHVQRGAGRQLHRIRHPGLGRPHARCRFVDHGRRHPLHGDGHRELTASPATPRSRWRRVVIPTRLSIWALPAPIRSTSTPWRRWRASSSTPSRPTTSSTRRRLAVRLR